MTSPFSKSAKSSKPSWSAKNPSSGTFKKVSPVSKPSYTPIISSATLFVGTVLEVGYGEGGYGEGGYDTPAHGVTPPSKPSWTRGSSE
jgi:hypothetical protein